MAGKSKKTYKPDYFASCGDEKDTFLTCYDSLLVSEQFKKLSPSAKNMYILCRNQLTSRNGRQCLYNHAKEFEISYPDNCFVFPSKQQERYGLKRTNSYRYLQELIDAGFIKKHEGNKHMWKVNVYQFCTDWKKK